MSSINGPSADKNRVDPVRKYKDEAESQAAEEARNHKAELRKVTEQFENRIEDMQEDFADKTKQMNEKMSSRLDDKEQVYQKQIQEIRGVFADQLKKKSEESGQQRADYKKTYAEASSKQKTINEVQKERLIQQYQNELKRKDDSQENYLKSSREEESKLWASRREKMNKAADAGLESQREAHEGELVGLHRELSEVRKNKINEVKNVKESQLTEKNRLVANFKRQTENQERTNSLVQKSLSDEFRLNQNLQKGDFRNKIVKIEEDTVKRDDNFREGLKDRIDREVNSLKQEIVEGRRQSVVDRSMQERLNNSEKKHLVQDYEVKLDHQRGEKNALLEESNTRVEKEVGKAVTGRDKIIQDMTERSRREKQMLSSTYHDNLAQVQTDLEARAAHSETRADQKVEMAENSMQKNNSFMKRFYDENMDQMRNVYTDELTDLRANSTEERTALENRLQKNMANQEKKMTVSRQNLINVNEKTIEELKDKQQREVRQKEAEMVHRLSAQEKAHAKDKEAIEGKFLVQIDKLKELHATEIDRINRRHQEELNRTVQRVVAGQGFKA